MGNGLAMRAGAVLEALCAVYRVSVLVTPIYKSFDSELPAPLRALIEDRIVSAVTEPWHDRVFDLVHVFRLSSMAAARHWLSGEGRVPIRHLDLDDIESRTHRRIAELCRANGDHEIGLREDEAARRSELLEMASYRRFERVYVCSETDRQHLFDRCPAQIVVLPNAVRRPDDFPSPPASAPSPGRPFQFLFLGTLGYYPNGDAVKYFCEHILPRMRAGSASPFEVTVAGTGASESLRELAEKAGVQVAGAVPDVSPLYVAANAVIAPIRAGGGTRIKILEAFSRRRPVAATSIALEGIDARHEEQALVADTPEEFAAACLRLMNSPELAGRLAEAAWRLWQRAYSLEAMKRSVSLHAVARPPTEFPAGGAQPFPK
jgi:glycosyltransferase involved in cell wall biosynthesis